MRSENKMGAGGVGLSRGLISNELPAEAGASPE